MKGEKKPDTEFECIKKKLEIAALQHNYNFSHPKVLEISEKLDHIIVQLMKRN